MRPILLLTTIALFIFLPAAAPPLAAGPKTLVVCAPGYPGDTASAQPTMDLFAKIASAAAGWPAGSLGAVYFETADGGLKRLAGNDAVLALVSLPFFLQHETALKLQAKLQVVEEAGSLATWSLAARRGRLTSPAALDGFEITGVSGYAPEFIRGPVLAAWGGIPAGARITSTTTVLSALRRAASGETIAVVLDDAQAKGLASLPFASDLEIVARSAPMPATLLCTIGSRLAARQAEGMTRGLVSLHTRSDASDLLKTMRMKRFEPIDAKALDAARRLFAAAASHAPEVKTPAESGGR